MDMVNTINQNIDLFLKDKKRKLTIDLSGVVDLLPQFWDEIGAAGDLEAALGEWDNLYNASPKDNGKKTSYRKYTSKLNRLVKGLPEYVKTV